jgi:hypothetical protein
VDAETTELHEFRPDWTLAPAVVLRHWIRETGVPARTIAFVAGGRERHGEALVLVQEVLDRKPLTEAHAAVLARGTHVLARMWLALEHNYRAGLAAGLKDVTED